METKRSLSKNLPPYLICIIESNKTGNKVSFDSEFFIIGVNNHATKTISNQRSHFISNFFPLLHQHIKGISGHISIKVQCTIRWNIEYDEGRVHTLDIKDALYVPESPLSTICPQHWDQQAKDNLPTQRGKYMANFDD